MYRKYNYQPEDQLQWYDNHCCDHEDELEEECKYNIIIDQRNEGDGGDGGEGGCGGIVQTSPGIAVNVCDNELDLSADITLPDLTPLVNAIGKAEGNAALLPPPNGTGTELNASGGNANGGDVYNINLAILVFPGTNGDPSPFPVYNVRANNKNFEIRLDDVGPTINGSRMNEQTLEDGTKVLVMKESKKSKK